MMLFEGPAAPGRGTLRRLSATCSPRRAFVARCAELEAGTACEAWRGVLTAFVGGEGRAEELAALRSHLRRCPACRATLRALHAGSASIGTVLPPGLLGAATVESHGAAERLEAAGRWLARLGETLAGSIQERVGMGALQRQAAVEGTATGKLAAVAASTVALAGGGAVAAHDAVRPDRPAERPAVGRRRARRRDVGPKRAVAARRRARGAAACGPRAGRSGELRRRQWLLRFCRPP